MASSGNGSEGRSLNSSTIEGEGDANSTDKVDGLRLALPNGWLVGVGMEVVGLFLVISLLLALLVEGHCMEW